MPDSSIIETEMAHTKEDVRHKGLLHSSFSKDYPVIERGDGVFLYDKRGKEYLDGSSSAIVANIGHGVGEIADAAYAQFSKVAFTYRTQFTNEKVEELSSRILGHAEDKAGAFFLSSGSEANEAAIRLALQYWREVGQPEKRRILSRKVSYHGNTLGALSLSSDVRRLELGDYSIEEPIIPPCYCYRCPFGREPDLCDVECADFLESAILRIGAGNVAAFVTEPIIGATGGAIVPHDSYLKRVRDICDRHNVLLIVDEVITGFGRTGKWFGMHHWNVSSDITVLGKGINAGFTPLSSILVSEQIVDAIAHGTGRITIGNTHSGNALSAAICCAVIDYIEANALVERAQTIGVHLGEALKSLVEKHQIIGDVRGVGLLWGLEIVESKTSKTPFCPRRAVTDGLVKHAFDEGLIVYPCRGLTESTGGDAILVAPPLVINTDQVDLLLERLDLSLTRLRDTMVGRKSREEVL